ncbi:hypothetical protein FM037_24550 [Shewanella psychropiezotolerans]|uniref:Lipoprotein n=1 Tax=Shewanella psychropiezotolerans TaxID=2593655 RepID=A0ABX5X3B6_9GAMM|nr:hypothetical protein [Shewanella psychropiezotolerans]QDO85850.1 hypothetical protein FM037_24550 [Shewanella psychropiezotolerans]
MGKIPFLVMSSLACSTVFASEIVDTTITRLMMDSTYGQKVFIKTAGVVTRDNCHSTATWDYVLSTDSEFGKQVYAQLLTAYAAKKKLKLVGSGVCIVNGSIEGLKRLELY